MELRRRASLGWHIKRFPAGLGRDRDHDGRRERVLNPARMRFRAFEISIFQRGTRVN